MKNSILGLPEEIKVIINSKMEMHVIYIMNMMGFSKHRLTKR